MRSLVLDKFTHTFTFYISLSKKNRCSTSSNPRTQASKCAAMRSTLAINPWGESPKVKNSYQWANQVGLRPPTFKNKNKTKRQKKKFHSGNQ